MVHIDEKKVSIPSYTCVLNLHMFDSHNDSLPDLYALTYVREVRSKENENET